MTSDAAAAPSATATPREATYRPEHALDLFATVGMLRRGGTDPTMVIGGGRLWRASRTPDGVATLALRQAPSGEVRATAWGPGARRALDDVPRLCGAVDDPTGFDASQHPLIAEADRRNPGLRLPRTDGVFDALACAILEQKVTQMQAFSSWRSLVSQFGERAPGPTPRPMFAPPTADQWRLIPSWGWHRAGVEPPLSKTIVRAATRADSIRRSLLDAPDGTARDRVLTSLPGVGPWTSAETRLRALGDADAVAIGDFHLAHEVGHALAGSRTDDAGMLRLLEPWAGHRQRVIQLIFRSRVREPRRGARLAPMNHKGR